MGNRLRDGEKAMYVVSSWEHCLGYLPGCRACHRDQVDHLPLPILNSPEVAVEEFVEVVHRITMTPVDQGRGEGEQACQTNEILHEGGKALGRIDRVGR